VRPTPARAALAVLGAALVTTSLAGCQQALPVEPPDLSGTEAYACATLHSKLPDEVEGHTVTALDPRSPYTAGWGQPTIVWRCGVPVPSTLTPTSQTIVVDGVEWFPEKLTDGYLFTTVGRQLTVDVSVPSAYSPEAGALVDLSPSVAAQIPLVSPSPSPSAS
jgi:hypothetical protein